MAANRPRPSLINLFDPLVNSSTNSEIPSTPQRHDVIDADKENVNTNSPFNNLTMTMFVNKISKPSSHPQPMPLRRRLVDIGDMTLEDASRPDALLDESLEEEFSASFEQSPEEDENATLTFKDMVKAATPLRKLNTVMELSTHGPSPMPRIPLADLVLAQATSTPLPEGDNELLVLGEPSEKPITEDSALEQVLSNELKLQEAAKPGLAVGLSAAPESIPLPLSPTMATSELALSASLITECDQAASVNAKVPLDTLTNIDTTTTPLSIDDANKDGTGKNDSEKHDAHLSSAEECIPSKPNTSSQSLKFDTSTNDLSPAANISDSSESSDASSADTSIPLVISQSSPPSSPISPPLEPESKSEATDTVSPLPLATLRPRLPTMAPDNRVSVDLHASFQLHMQSEEMSFDLLSDKVSFLSAQGGMESFLTTNEDDPSFDLETERINMEKALKKYAEAKEQQVDKVPLTKDDTSSSSSSSDPVTLVDVSNVPSTPSHSNSGTQRVAGADLKTTRKRLSIPVAVSSPRLIDVSPINTSQLTRSTSLSSSPGSGLPVRTSPQRSPVASSGSVFAPPPPLQARRKSIHLVTPKSVRESAVPEMPVAAPVLKIVKRSRPNGHGRTESTSAMTGNIAKTERKSSLELGTGLKELGMSTVGLLKTRKPIQVQETPQKAVVEPALSTASQQRARPRSMGPPRSSFSLAQSSVLGPRRVPAGDGSQPKSTVSKITMPSPASGGPRRVLVPSSSSLTRSQPRTSVGITSTPKVPSQASTTASTTSSALPTPSSRPSLTSRLPAPRSLKAGGLSTLRRAT
ncbi:hypothetical protein D9756_006040 [Leucocoprinus leucothites]|uniref:Uncharacterized protein n=1 Tax=Leucocoprinus leucothites TaxID=201217 RepID=A0A8H5FXH2_9AGAR|nr:hypothetical protein D9756_006040 [Leucoagaricus leucothites]